MSRIPADCRLRR